MADMGNHARKGWTFWETVLAAAFAVLGAAIAVFAFIVIFLTVTHLVSPWFAGWSWVVLAVTEGAFTGSYLGWLLLDLRDKPPRKIRVILACYLSAFAAGSLSLNIYAARDSFPDAVAHALTVAAFFGYLVLGKVIVARLSVTAAERKLAEETADAIAHARDILRGELGAWWRFRAPVLLRRQLRSGRLPAKVLEAVGNGARFGGATVWEPVVEAWIASAVTLPERTAEALRAARGTVSAAVPGTARGGIPEHAPEASSGVPAPRPRARPARASRPALRLTAARSRGMSPDTLAGHVEAMLGEYGSVSLNRVKTDLSIGTEKAKAALEIARRNRARVVPIGERRQA